MNLKTNTPAEVFKTTLPNPLLSKLYAVGELVRTVSPVCGAPMLFTSTIPAVMWPLPSAVKLAAMARGPEEVYPCVKIANCPHRIPGAGEQLVIGVGILTEALEPAPPPETVAETVRGEVAPVPI